MKAASYKKRGIMDGSTKLRLTAWAKTQTTAKSALVSGASLLGCFLHRYADSANHIVLKKSTSYNAYW